MLTKHFERAKTNKSKNSCVISNLHMTYESLNYELYCISKTTSTKPKEEKALNAYCFCADD